jgi:DNA-binding NarL/FixJ family response regulator
LKQVPSHAPVDPSDRMSVLLVDDSPSDRLLLSHQLVADGSYDVVGEAPDGPTAVALTGRLHPDVVLLDMAMPGMNGLEALPLLLETSPTSRVVIFSGYLSKGLREQAMAAGAASIFEKGMGYEGVLEHLSMLNSDWPGTVTVPTNGRPAVPVEAGA